MTTTEDVGKALIALVAEGRYLDAIDEYYSPAIISTEPQGDPATLRGIAAVREKQAWWASMFETLGIEANGPYVCGAQFIAEYTMDVVNKHDGKRSILHETALYTVENGKIIDEKFFAAVD